MFKNFKGLWLVALVLAFAAGLLAPPTPAAGHRLVVHLNQPFEVDGEVFPAGELSLREIREYSPVATLNEICVDGRSLGFVLARNIVGSDHSTRDEVIFERDRLGHLVLFSVATKGEPVRRLYRLGAGEQAGAWQAMNRPQPPALVASTQ